MLNRLINIIADYGVSHNSIFPDSHIIKDMQMEPEDIPGMIHQIENEFNVSISAVELEADPTVRELLEHIVDYA